MCYGNFLCVLPYFFSLSMIILPKEGLFEMAVYKLTFKIMSWMNGSGTGEANA